MYMHTYYVPTVDEQPQLRDLQSYIIPRYASFWREVGTGLGLKQETLSKIETDYHQSKKQCNVVLSHWLEVKADAATWKKLLSVIDCLTVSVIQDHSGIVA